MKLKTEESSKVSRKIVLIYKETKIPRTKVYAKKNQPPDIDGKGFCLSRHTNKTMYAMIGAVSERPMSGISSTGTLVKIMKATSAIINELSICLFMLIS